MISVSEALNRVQDLFQPLEVEKVPLRHAAGRVLAHAAVARRDQPPFAASSMDGYALKSSEAVVGARFKVIGESAAGSGFATAISPGQAARIFTGAPVPKGADKVVMQEDTRRDDDMMILLDSLDNNKYIRPQGDDFKVGDSIPAPKRLNANDVALLASMNIAEVPVYRRPIVALVATGDELVMPGEDPGPDQIIASNNFGLAALLEQHGAEVRMLPIARDHADSLKLVFRLCEGADLVVTIGGASVGDHDIVHSVASELGLDTAFYKVAMRPGKPLMAGKMGRLPLIGLPGNPVSSMVCGHVFLRPALNVMSGLGGGPLTREQVRLGRALAANSNREHYLRARLQTENGQLTVHPESRQDSALLSVLANSDGMLVRPPMDPPRRVGDMVEVIRF